MLGGNPINECVTPMKPGISILRLTQVETFSRFGFRYWKNPGPWAGEDASGRLISFVNAVNVAGFCMAGPEYISSKSECPTFHETLASSVLTHGF